MVCLAQVGAVIKYSVDKYDENNKLIETVEVTQELTVEEAKKLKEELQCQ